MSSRSRRSWLVAAAAMFPLMVSLAGPVAAKEGAEAWLDHSLPGSAAGGTTVSVGFWVGFRAPDGWHPFPDGGLFLRVRPAAGGAPIEVMATREPTTGHFSADLAVPKGGIASGEVGLAGTGCDASGCGRVDEIFPIRGVGLPPGIAVHDLVTASVEGIPATVSPGSSVPVRIVLTPRAGSMLSDLASVSVPPLVVQLNDVSSRSIDYVTARPSGTPGVYVADITFPAKGRYWLQVGPGTPANGMDSVFEESVTMVAVPGGVDHGSAPVASEPGLPAAAPAGQRGPAQAAEQSPAVPVAGILGLVAIVFGIGLAGVLGIRRARSHRPARA